MIYTAEIYKIIWDIAIIKINLLDTIIIITIITTIIIAII